ncbi:hypothetical protein MTR_3g065070 [Medicago truncatula]|uniref:Uncharacterized protein n=1 Tax=Medicago truncatula TaxID=3880 RepID=G7J8Q7_MEDTR|nr:hypothetical protein MTR_3g065070 [Medicago truncatula]
MSLVLALSSDFGIDPYTFFCLELVSLSLFYPGGGMVDGLPCTILGSATKRLKESDMVVTQPSNNFGR